MKLTKKDAGVREFRDHVSTYLRRARRGQETVITSRGKEVARLVPVSTRLPFEVLEPRISDAGARRAMLEELVAEMKAGTKRPKQKPIDVQELLDWERGDR